MLRPLRRHLHPDEAMVRSGYSPRRGDWTFLAICSHCGSVRSPTIVLAVVAVTPRTAPAPSVPGGHPVPPPSLD